MLVLIFSFIAMLTTAISLFAIYKCKQLKLEKTILQIKCMFFQLS